ncbi:MAG: FtsH protease activity modulator HflK [Thermodesulfobacteriota bacterium]|nr:FtsH protease activity modulator HflK [Thermodesulfobacteriota bacterium]
MSWDPNEQGGGHERGNGGPDIEDIIRKAAGRFSGGGSGRNYMWAVIIIALIAIGIATSAYTIPAGHRGVLVRFGRYVDTLSPGLHFKIPFGVDHVYKVYTEKIDTETFGFTNVSPGVRSRFDRSDYGKKESLMLTGDLNVVDMEWIVQYRKQDPREYLFQVNDPIQTLKDVSESVIRRIVGDCTFDYVLQNRNEISSLFEEQLQAILNEYKSGINIVNIRLQNVVPPDAVKGAFNEVNEAQQEKERLINEAQENYNREIPKAKGNALGLVNQAQGYAMERVNYAKGDVARFSDVLMAYKGSKEVTMKRMYFEACEKIIPTARKVFILDSDHKGVLPLLQLDDIQGRGGEK